MIDIADIEKYREGNRIEAKKAAGGLPSSLWETYSAFANSEGGVILLGMDESSDGTLSVVGVNNTERLVKDFWNTINNHQKVSINLLRSNKVTIHESEGKEVIIIDVPQAERADRPVYIGENPYKGAFRRNGEGDYHCSEDEVNAMFRDKSVKTQDMLILDNMDFTALCFETVHSYRNAMRAARPEHVWTNIDDEDFLYRIGAVAFGEDRILHPTAAGLLMFGYEYEIVKEYPYYFLDYQEQFDISTRWDDRIVSSSGDWSGNIYDFFRKAYNKLAQNIKVPFQIVDGLRVEDTPIHRAVREALANCLINADYYGRQGLVVKLKPMEISFENPGRFRISIKTAIEGIVTDPRNSLLMKFFNLIDVGERSGRGVYEIFKVWSEHKFELPKLFEIADVDRTVLLLSLKKETEKSDGKKATVKSDGKRDANVTLQQKEKLIAYVKANGFVSAKTTAELLNVSRTRAKVLLYILVDEMILSPQGTAKNRTYNLSPQSVT